MRRALPAIKATMLLFTPRQLSSVRNGSSANFGAWARGSGGVANWPALQDERGLGIMSSQASGSATGTDKGGVITALPFSRHLLHSLQTMARSLERQGLELPTCAEKLLPPECSAGGILGEKWPSMNEGQSVFVAPADFLKVRGLPSTPVSGAVNLSRLCALSHHHFSHHQSFATSAPQSSSSNQSADSVNDQPAPSTSGGSWFGRVKGMLGMGKKDEDKQEEAFTLESEFSSRLF